jgi:hypothetical protein
MSLVYMLLDSDGLTRCFLRLHLLHAKATRDFRTGDVDISKSTLFGVAVDSVDGSNVEQV